MMGRMFIFNSIDELCIIDEEVGLWIKKVFNLENNIYDKNPQLLAPFKQRFLNEYEIKSDLIMILTFLFTQTQ